MTAKATATTTTATAKIKSIDDLVREHVEKVLAQFHGNKTRAAKALGVDRRSLYRMLDRWKREAAFN